MAAPSAAGCGINPRAPVTPTLHAEIENSGDTERALLRAEKIEQCAGEPDEKAGEQHVLQDHQRSARRFCRRSHVVDLPGGNGREGDDHHPGIFGSLFGQA